MRVPCTRLPHWIDGKPTQPGNGRWAGRVRAGHGQPFAQVADGDARDVEAAVAAARAAFPPGRRCPTANAAAGCAASPMRWKPGSTTSPAPKPATAGNLSARARGRDPARGLEPALLRRRGDAVLQRIAPRRSRGWNHLRQPLGVVGNDPAVEPAAVPVHLEDRAGAGPQGNTVVAKPSESPAQRDLAPAKSRRTSGSRRRAQHRARPRPERSARAIVAHPEVRRSASPAAPRSAAASSASPRRC